MFIQETALYKPKTRTNDTLRLNDQQNQAPKIKHTQGLFQF